MAFSKNVLKMSALVGTAALVLAVGCSDSDPIEDGTGGSTTTANGGNGTGGNGTGGMGTGGDATGGNGTGGSPAAATCASYCADVTTNCTDTLAQWDTVTPTPQETCEDWCTIWDQGSPGDMSGDTLECRAYHTGAAAGDATTHCAHAGPLGNGACGTSQCEVFCDALMLLCTGNDQQYGGDTTACLNDCTALPDATTPFVADNSNNSPATLACRAYHLSAAVDAPMDHCGHAAGMGLCNGT